MKPAEIITKYLKELPTRTVGSAVIAEVTEENLIKVVKSLHSVHALPLLIMKAADQRKEGIGFVIYYVFGIPKTNKYKLILELKLEKYGFPSIVSVVHKASLYEQEIQTFFGLDPVGHPFDNQLILHENWPKDLFPLRKDFPWNKRVPMSKGIPYTFQEVEGEGIYEIPVGPVHAGIIEPGHFRFSVVGERIVSLQPQLGYVHKGSEKLFEVLPLPDKIKLSENISGDMSFSHSLAFCQALEELSSVDVPAYAKYLRVVYSELERIANHMNDVGFILNDTAFSFGGSNGMRLKEKIMQLNEKLTGSRFLRGINTIGGVTKGLSGDLLGYTVKYLQEISKDFQQFVDVSLDNEIVLNRLSGTGVLTQEVARDHGAVGMVARSSGIAKDVRVYYPYAGYEKIHVKICIQQEGDVFARFKLRVDEVHESIRLITSAIEHLKKEKPILKASENKFAQNSFATSLTEGWRGGIIYFVMTDQNGDISRVGVRDPSFINWQVVPYAVAGNIVPDFPLINKSFNLSYSGFDR